MYISDFSTPTLSAVKAKNKRVSGLVTKVNG